VRQHWTVASGPISDAELVSHCRQGDSEAWNELVTRFSRYVFAIATQAFRLREQDAEDVFQEVFTKVYERLDQLREDEAIRPWIGQLTRRVCINRLRTSAREQPAEFDLDVAEPVDTIGRLDEAFAVHQALATLPEHCNEILDRFFAQDESYRTIADALDLPAGTIASRISRCLGKLREEFEGRNPAPRESGERVI
jgi:RNA polymerase sigma factor (sigma-70 family)